MARYRDLVQHQGIATLLNTYLRGIRPIGAMARLAEVTADFIAAPVRGYMSGQGGGPRQMGGVDGMVRATLRAGRVMATALVVEGSTLVQVATEAGQAVLDGAVATVEELGAVELDPRRDS